MTATVAGGGDDPVFVDRTGRRRRLVEWLGITLAVVLVLGLMVLVAGVFGASPVPLPGLPPRHADAGPGRGVVSTTPSPAATPSSPRRGSAEPGESRAPTGARVSPPGPPTQAPTPADTTVERRRGPPTDRPHPGKSK